ncbi:hypothetical protein MTO96_004430 [Rhipicephalus appendiculatus]
MTSIRLKVVLLLAAPFLCYYVQMQARNLWTAELRGHPCPLLYSQVNRNYTKLLPRILMWTLYFREWFETNNKTRIGEALVENCSVKCLVANDPCLTEHSDAVVFHVRNMKITQLPSKRFSWQKWVFFIMESPPHTDFIYFD